MGRNWLPIQYYPSSIEVPPDTGYNRNPAVIDHAGGQAHQDCGLQSGYIWVNGDSPHETVTPGEVEFDIDRSMTMEAINNMHAQYYA